MATHILTGEIGLGDIDDGRTYMDRRYCLLGQNRGNNCSFLQCAASLKGPVSDKYQDYRRVGLRHTNLQQREKYAFEKRSWLVHGSYERFVIVYVEFTVIRDVYPDGIQQNEMKIYPQLFRFHRGNKDFCGHPTGVGAPLLWVRKFETGGPL